MQKVINRIIVNYRRAVKTRKWTVFEKADGSFLCSSSLCRFTIRIFKSVFKLLDRPISLRPILLKSILKVITRYEVIVYRIFKELLTSRLSYQEIAKI